MNGNNALDFAMLIALVLFLAVPLAGIAILSLIKERGKFSLLSVLTVLTVTAILLGAASYVFRK